jgi:hypothetical protein
MADAWGLDCCVAIATPDTMQQSVKAASLKAGKGLRFIL